VRERLSRNPAEPFEHHHHYGGALPLWGIDGLEMFQGQAEVQFFIWTGRHLPEASKPPMGP